MSGQDDDDFNEEEGDLVMDLQMSPKRPEKAAGGVDFGMSTTFDWNPASSGTATTVKLKSLVEHDQRFVGKTIVITGAGGQLGREGCCYFAMRGAKLAAMDRSKEGLKETFDVLNKDIRTDKSSNILTFDFKPYVCDVTNAEQMSAIMDSIVHRYQQIDYVWNNAGYQGKIKPLTMLDADDYRMTMDINVTGMFIVLQAASRKMVQLSTADCSIVNTSSVAGQRGTPYMAGYSASKAAVLALSVNAAKELAPYQIRVNAVSPALIGPGFLWERQNKLHAKAGAPFYDPDPEVVAQNKIQQVPLRRLGTPEEVVSVVAFLFSKDASYVTGTNINIDGGLGCSVRG